MVNVFGGYTPLDWVHNDHYIRDDTEEGFIFSINYNSILRHFEKPEYAIYYNKLFGPCFGPDILYIGSECNKIKNSTSNLGSGYEAPDGKFYDSIEIRII